MQQTLVVIKPDAVQRGLAGEILRRLERKGVKIVALKMVCVSAEMARRMYAVHEGKEFYDRLMEFITAGPVIAAVLAASTASSTASAAITTPSPQSTARPAPSR